MQFCKILHFIYSWEKRENLFFGFDLPAQVGHKLKSLTANAQLLLGNSSFATRIAFGGSSRCWLIGPGLLHSPLLVILNDKRFSAPFLC